MKSHALWMVLGGVILAAPVWGQDSVELLHRDVPEKQAVIWYLGQDSFAVKTHEHLLIFDPLNPGMENSYKLPASADSLSEGVVNPETIKDLNVVVLDSDMNDSHYGTGMWPWKRYIGNITYVFGWDPIINQDNHEYIFLKPHEEKAIDGMDVTTMQSDVHGSGFLVKVDGLTLFFGGNAIVLEPEQKQRFESEIDFIARKAPHVDLAFLEFQNGAGNRPPSVAEGIWYADKKLSPRAIFPMGAMNGEVPFRLRRTPEGQKEAAIGYEPLIQDLMREAPSDAVRAKIVPTERRGKVFFYRDGKVTPQ
jgi:L-ascorbate metabolism protein UlaG (beta-lactamase superfamily)